MKRAAILFVGVALVMWCAREVQAAEMICFEAEAVTNVVAPFEVVSVAKDVSGGKCLKIAEGANKSGGNGTNGYAVADVLPVATNTNKACEVLSKVAPKGSVQFTFRVKKTKRYVMWCRVRWDNVCGNSFSAAIDDALPFTFGQNATYKKWHWVQAPPRLKQLKLSKGVHTLTIKNREDGIMIDQIIFTSSRRLIPVGVETATVAVSVK